MELHPLVERVLKRVGLEESGGGPPTDADKWRSLLERLSRICTDADQDRYLLERSLALSSEEMRLSEERYRATFSQAPIGIAHIEFDGRFLLVNDCLCALIGYTREELMGMSFAQLIHPGDMDEDARQTSRLLVGEIDRFSAEERLICKDGAVVWVNIARSMVRGPDGAARYVVGVIEDYTQRKRLEEHLVAASEAAEAANRAKSAFLANMSHEIRTPMTAILGYADLLVSDEGDGSDGAARRMEWVQTIRQNGEHLLSVVNDILDVSKIEAGKLDIERIPCQTDRIVSEMLSLMRVKALDKRLALEVEYAGLLPCTVRTDPTRLHQILTNLVGNAIKFTERGSVRLVVSFHGGEQSGSLRFDVVDTGIGLAPDEIQHLFQPFSQADATTTRRFGGTGLGLVISKRLANLLGGDLSVQSTPGMGSTFTVSIDTGPIAERDLVDHSAEPLGPTSVKRHDAEPAPVLEGIRILLAEDGADNQRLIAFLLRKSGAEVALAENGRIACEAALESAASGQPFDVILMDMQMQELDGYSATSLLRAQGWTRPILALTANAMAGDREKCLRAGCNDFLTKPIDTSALLSACVNWHKATDSPLAV